LVDTTGAGIGPDLRFKTLRLAGRTLHQGASGKEMSGYPTNRELAAPAHAGEIEMGEGYENPQPALTCPLGLSNRCDSYTELLRHSLLATRTVPCQFPEQKLCRSRGGSFLEPAERLRPLELNLALFPALDARLARASQSSARLLFPHSSARCLIDD